MRLKMSLRLELIEKGSVQSDSACITSQKSLAVRLLDENQIQR